AAGRGAAGHAGLADLADPRVGTGTRTHDRTRDRAPLGRRASGRAWIALPGAASAGGSRLDSGFLGDVGEQPQGALLPADADGAEATATAGFAMGATGRSDQPGAETGVGLRKSNELAATFSAREVGPGAGAGAGSAPGNRNSGKHCAGDDSARSALRGAAEV